MRFDIKTNCDNSEYFINRINDDGSLTLLEIRPAGNIVNHLVSTWTLMDCESICPDNCSVHKERQEVRMKPRYNITGRSGEGFFAHRGEIGDLRYISEMLGPFDTYEQAEKCVLDYEEVTE